MIDFNKVYIPIPDQADRGNITRRKWCEKILRRSLNVREWRHMKGARGIWVGSCHFNVLKRFPTVPLPPIVLRVKRG